MKQGKKTIEYISSISFGIYFVHICIMEGMNIFLDRMSNITGFASFAVLECSSFILSVVVIYLLSKSKLLKQYLFLIK